MKSEIAKFLNQYAPEFERTLIEMLSFQSISGNESEIQSYLAEKFEKLGYEVEKHFVSESIKSDPEYSFGLENLCYEKRPNLVVTLKGSGDGKGKSAILNSHTDVVPANDWAEAFCARSENGVIYGRGACDAKGQVLTIYAVFAALKALNINLSGDAMAQIVIEEEAGGNGSLALIRDGYKADGVIVLEGTNFKIHPANRGAIWYRVKVEGKSVHMARIKAGINAIEKLMKVAAAFREYESQLVAECANHPLFLQYDQPAQVNIGMLRGGDWPSTVPAFATLEGGVGFLPNKAMESVKVDLKAAIEGINDDWLKKHYTLEFPKLHNDSYEIPTDHPLVKALESVCQESEIKTEVTGWIASCDARLFNKVGNIPVVVFGPGDIADAHSSNERIKLADILKAAEILTLFLIKWCG